MESILAAPLSLRCDPLSCRLDRLQSEQADVFRQGDGDAAGGELQGLVGAQRVFVQPVEVAQGRVVAGAVNGANHNPALGDFHWLDEEALRSNQPLKLASCGVDLPLAEDVRLLAIKAIEAAREAAVPRRGRENG